MNSVTLVIPWPRFPTHTPAGKLSKAKNAGRLVPFLSANVVNNLPGPVYRNHKIAWREAARCAASKQWGAVAECELDVRLYKATRNLMDPLAVLEGLKPIIDGLEATGMLRNDRDVVGGRAAAFKAASRDKCRVEITLTPLEDHP